MEYRGFIEQSGKGFRIVSLRNLSKDHGRLSVPIDDRFIDSYDLFSGACLQILAEMKQGQFQYMIGNDHEYGCSARTLSKESGYSIRHIRRKKTQGHMYFVKNTHTVLFKCLEGKMNGELKKQLDRGLEMMKKQCPRHAKVCCNVSLKRDDYGQLPTLTYIHAYYQFPDIFTRVVTAENRRNNLDDFDAFASELNTTIGKNKRYVSQNLVKERETKNKQDSTHIFNPFLINNGIPGRDIIE